MYVVNKARRRLLAAGAGLAGALALAGCARDAPQDTWQPEGDNAQKIHDLQWWVFAIAGVIGVIVIVVVVYCVVRFRDKGQPIPEQTHGRPALEIGLTILPALILIVVAVPTVGTLMALNKTSDTECVVNTTGQQWWWEMDYPAGQCGDVEIPVPIITSGQLVIPSGTNVLLRGTSRDVIHSFWVPKINGKRDMVPGRIHTLRLQSDRPGIYAGQCAEFCGLSHANMKMEIVVLSPADFQIWVDEQLAEYESPTDQLALEGESVFISQCARCHQVDGLTDADGDPVIAHPEDQVYSGAAPNLTNFASRNTFAGATWDLLTPECRETVWEADPDDFGAIYLTGVTPECFNAVDLREWLRDAPTKKPMYADPDELAATDGLPRGMPYLGLSEDQIDALVAYLLELN
jgi:cytochrome c oxidase subunit 2